MSAWLGKVSLSEPYNDRGGPPTDTEREGRMDPFRDLDVIPANVWLALGYAIRQAQLTGRTLSPAEQDDVLESALRHDAAGDAFDARTGTWRPPAGPDDRTR